MKNILVIGGGISGLTSAYLLAKTGKFNIHIVEKNDTLGGLLRSFHYDGHGYFDYGAHNILEPAFLKKKVIVGPYYRNFESESKILKELNILKVVKNPIDILRYVNINENKADFEKLLVLERKEGNKRKKIRDEILL